jgi:alpha-amylase
VEVMMQAFYWDVPAGGTVEYYKYKKSLLGQMLELFYLASAGFKSKRSILMGYDPTDYF